MPPPAHGWRGIHPPHLSQLRCQCQRFPRTSQALSHGSQSCSRRLLDRPSGYSRKLFARPTASIGIRYHASTGCTCAAITSISFFVYLFFPLRRVECTGCTSYPPRYNLPVPFTCTRITRSPSRPHTTKSQRSLSPQGNATLNPIVVAFSKNAACEISPDFFGFLRTRSHHFSPASAIPLMYGIVMPCAPRSVAFPVPNDPAHSAAVVS